MHPSPLEQPIIFLIAAFARRWFKHRSTKRSKVTQVHILELLSINSIVYFLREIEIERTRSRTASIK